MKKYILICLYFVFSLSLFSTYPNNFFGQATIGPVTKYENEIIFTFGTYHQETRHQFEVIRLNSLDQNHKLMQLKCYRGHDFNDFEMSFHEGYQYVYDNSGKIISINEIDDNNYYIAPICEYQYYDCSLQFMNLPDSTTFHYLGNQSVQVNYLDYDGVFQTNMLITYILDNTGLTQGWVGRNYAYNCDIFSLGSFTYDDQGNLATIYYETPASKEHVILQDTLYWNGDKLTSIHSNYQTDYLEYDENGRISEIAVFNNLNNSLSQMYYYDYDEYGRMISETIEHYYYYGNDIDRIDCYQYEYNDYCSNYDNPYVSASEVQLINYPNPFNPQTTIQFSLAKKQKVSLHIYNIKGQKIRTLLDEEEKVGKHLVNWNGINDNQMKVSSGVYLYQLKTKNQSYTKRMLLLK